MVDPITTTGTAGNIQYSGLTSDTKWADFVDDLVEIERFHINRLEAWKSEWQNKTTVISQLESNLLILESKAGDINSYQKFNSTTASSSDEDVLTVTSNSFAETGAHSITVGTNIPHMVGTQGLSSNSTAVGTIGEQDLVIQVGSNTVTVNYVDGGLGNDEFDSSSTLADIASAINAAGSSYLTASIIGDGSSTNRYRLVLTANTGGDDNLISVTSNPLNLNFSSNDISNTVETTWTGATVSAGGISTASEDKTYTFTASGSGTVGSGTLLLSWGDGTGNTGSINVGSGYTGGSLIDVADGLKLSFAASGSVTSGQEFKVNVYNNIEDVVETDWRETFATPQASGHYSGTTNKVFNFSVFDTGTLGTDEIRLHWWDSEGNSDTVTIPSTYGNGDEIEIYQGLNVKFDTSSTASLVESGRFAISVTNSTLQTGQDTGLAQSEIESHSGFVDKDLTYATTTSASFSYTYGGISRTVTIPANSTLENVAAEINGDEDNPGVSAIIVNDGSGLSTAYHLQLVGKDTGAAYKIENISHTLNVLSGSSTDGYGFSETQAAQNAMLKVDGYPADSSEYIQRSSNTVGDVITGVTLSLIDTGNTTVTVNTDMSDVKTNIQEFVDELNAVFDYITAMTTHIESGDDQYDGLMQGNYTFQIISQNLNSILTSPVPGLTDGTDAYTLLSQIGINTEEDQISVEDENGITWTKTTRRWVVDEDKLDEALKEDFQAVANLFISDENTEVDGIAELIHSETDRLTKEYIDENPGILQVLNNNYDNIIDNIDSKIEREERRITMVEDRLNRQYAALETLLGQLQGQENALIAILGANESE